ncbi:MAG: DNA polymerase III subunit delta [Gemmatimonadaceae bacterium]|nr:DNA polymerase III subunit delta [Acetobacteraceae bacterium]
MKLDAGRIAAFLRNPGPARVVLLYGEDEGTVRHRADALTTTVVGARDDPFRVAWLSREDHTRLAEEASAIAMLGGRRVVRVREAGDALSESVARAAAGGGDSLIILEAGALPGRSKLRATITALPTGVAIACYPEEMDAVRAVIRAEMSAGGIDLDPEGLEWLLQHLGNDRAATRGEIDKLVLYAGAERRLDLAAVRTCVGDLAAVSFDDALFAATAGDVALADISLERTLAEGMAAVAIARGILAHLGKLHIVRGHMAAGLSAGEAVRALRPPVFFKRVTAITQAAGWWTTARLVAALREATRVEMLCKQTGAPDTLLVRRLLLGLARQGQSFRTRA